MSAPLLAAAAQLAAASRRCRFQAPVAHVYYPLQYAWQSYAQYVCRYGGGRKKAVFVGMNPGPWGMAQTGIPFGDVVSVRDWLGITAEIESPRLTHPKRPVLGFSCRRREVSGSRLWTFFSRRYQSAEIFFADHFVVNYCPLFFLRASGANLTPDKLAAGKTLARLYRCCDEHLEQVVAILQPQLVVGIGSFAEKRLQMLFSAQTNLTVGKMLHPSPASPAANRAFDSIAARELDSLGL